MSEVVNFNKARKAKLKQRQAAQAKENRVIYGISTKVRKIAKLNEERDVAKLEQAKLTAETTTKRVDEKQ